MSHFTVLVTNAANEDELDATMLPYHEYESTGIKKYLEEVVQVAASDIEAEIGRIKEYDDDADLDYLLEYYGGYLNEDGDIVRLTNPNAKWDWYLVGGRWTNRILRKRSIDAIGASGTPGAFGDRGDAVLYCDHACVKDVDFRGMLADKLAAREREWDTFHKVYEQPCVATDKNEESYAAWRGRYDKVKNHIYDADHFARVHAAFNAIDDPLWGLGDFLKINVPKEEYVKPVALTFALVHEGVWYQRGEMGWFGFSDEERGSKDYDSLWWEIVGNLDDDDFVTVVDCHI